MVLFLRKGGETDHVHVVIPIVPDLQLGRSHVAAPHLYTKTQKNLPGGRRVKIEIRVHPARVSVGLSCLDKLYCLRIVCPICGCAIAYSNC